MAWVRVQHLPLIPERLRTARSSPVNSDHRTCLIWAKLFKAFCSAIICAKSISSFCPVPLSQSVFVSPLKDKVFAAIDCQVTEAAWCSLYHHQGSSTTWRFLFFFKATFKVNLLYLSSAKVAFSAVFWFGFVFYLFSKKLSTLFCTYKLSIQY